jgi:hypothetical protein
MLPKLFPGGEFFSAGFFARRLKKRARLKNAAPQKTP